MLAIELPSERLRPLKTPRGEAIPPDLSSRPSACWEIRVGGTPPPLSGGVYGPTKPSTAPGDHQGSGRDPVPLQNPYGETWGDDVEWGW